MTQLGRFALAIALCVSFGSSYAQETSSTKEIENHVALSAVSRPGGPAKLHQQFLKRKNEGPIGVLFLGDSITQRWTSAPLVWNKYFSDFQPANFGIGGDRTQHVIWRITEGKELDGISPKVLVLMIGTNNSNTDEAEPIAAGVEKIISLIRKKMPETKILLLAVFPRQAKRDLPENKPMQRVREVNKIIAKLDDGKMIKFMDIGKEFTDESGSVPADIMPDGVHLSEKGYEIWGKTVKPVIEEMMK